MLLVHNISKKYDHEYLNKNIFNINLKKKSLILREKSHYDNRKKISDLTYNLFFSNKNNSKFKIKKIDTSFINKEKERNKASNIRILTDFRKREKNNSKEKNVNLKNNSELIKHKKINKVNSIIININNNKNNFKTNNSFLNSKFFQTQESFNNNKFLKNKNTDYFNDNSLTKKEINHFNSYYVNTYNIRKKNNNYQKIKIKLNKNNIRAQLNLRFSSKKPIKIKGNILENKSKSYIQKKNSEKLYNNKSINNESKHSNIFRHKLYYSNSFNTTNKILKNKKYLDLAQKNNKIAEKNYLEKWQLLNGFNIEKKYSLSNINSKKNLSIIPKNYLILEKNNAFSQRQRKSKSIDNIDFKKINVIDKNIYNNTEINKNIENDNDFFKCKTLENKKRAKKFETEKKIMNNEIIWNNTNIDIFHQVNENENENQGEFDDENINKIIERKKREIDLLNVMKFTSKLNNNHINNYDNMDDNMNLNYFNDYNIL